MVEYKVFIILFFCRYENTEQWWIDLKNYKNIKHLTKGEIFCNFYFKEVKNQKTKKPNWQNTKLLIT